MEITANIQWGWIVSQVRDLGMAQIDTLIRNLVADAIFYQTGSPVWNKVMDQVLTPVTEQVTFAENHVMDQTTSSAEHNGIHDTNR